MESRLKIGLACIAACTGLAACYIPPKRIQGKPIGGHVEAELARSADGVLAIREEVAGTYEYLPGFMPNGLLGITHDGHLLYEAWASESETTETFATSIFVGMGPSQRWTVKISDGVSGSYATLVDRIGGLVEYRRSSP